jgi:hypothetical protein
MKSNKKNNVNGDSTNSTNTENNEMKQEIVPESTAKQAPKKGRTRRTKALIEEEYELFKEFYDIGCPILEIITLMELTSARCSNYMSKISLEKNKHEQQYGVCNGGDLPESIRKILMGDKYDLFKYEKGQNGVFLTLLHRKN